MCFSGDNPGEQPVGAVGRGKEQQQEVKEAIVPILEQKYKQQFKLLSFKYEHKIRFDGRDLKTTEYGKYHFKIQAVDNPIIILDFDISDFATKDSIKPLIESFKKTQLNDLYCLGLSQYYKKNLDNDTMVKQPNTKKAEKYCRSIGFPIDKTFFVYTYKENHGIK